MRRSSLRVLDLAAVVAVVGLLQLVIGRFVVPHWQPPVGVTPPAWHAVMAWLGAFLRHFVGVLAPVVMVVQAFSILARDDRPLSYRGALVLAATVSLAAVALLGAAIIEIPDKWAIVVEMAFVVLVVRVAIAMLETPGDLAARTAIAFAAIPVLLHVIAVFGQHSIHDRLEGFRYWPDKVFEVAQWGIALIGLAAPLVFGPRPLSSAVLHPVPMVATVVISGAAPILVRRRFDLAAEIAGRGFGVQLHEPSGADVMWLLALLGMVWTITSCLVSHERGRRGVAVGLTLWTVGGFSFQWPYVMAICGLGFLVLLESVPEAGVEEAARAGGRVRGGARSAGPPSDPAAWRGYAELLAGELARGAVGLANPHLEIQLADDVEVTRLSGQRDHLPVRLTVSRDAAGVQSIVLTCGGDVPIDPPAWTLAARSRGLGGPALPPMSSGGPVKTGDVSFDRRFLVHDGAQVTGELLDDGLRARAAAILDGWIALWPGRALRWVLSPGKHGVPADEPIPTGDLGAPGATDALVRLVDLITTIAARAPLNRPN